MPFLLYLAGIAALAVAGWFGYETVQSFTGSLQPTPSAYATAAALLAALALFATGRALWLLTRIWINSESSREYARYLERLDPAIAAQLDQERAGRVARKGFGPYSGR